MSGNSRRLSVKEETQTTSTLFPATTHLSGLAQDFHENVLVAFGATVPRIAAAVEADGSLSPSAGSPVAPSIAPTGATLSPDGRRLFGPRPSTRLLKLGLARRLGRLRRGWTKATHLGAQAPVADLLTVRAGQGQTCGVHASR